METQSELIEQIPNDDSKSIADAAETNADDVVATAPKRNLLALLRTLFKNEEFVDVEGGINAYILPRTDSHQVKINEFTYNFQNYFFPPFFDSKILNKKLRFYKNDTQFQNEYLVARDNRVAFISGFTGSYAFTIITETDARLWTDGRYFIQAEQELDDGWSLMKIGTAESIDPIDWIVGQLPAGSVIGFDPNLFSMSKSLLLLLLLLFE